MKLRPKGWEKFQHYKDRCPPWIKLHRDLLNNRDFMSLPLASKGLAPLLWLLASESPDGSFDATTDELEFRLRISRKEIEDAIKPLISSGFFELLAGCYQVAIPETERERETETEVETEKKAQQAAPVFPEKLDCTTFRNIWEEFRTHRKQIRNKLTPLAEKRLLKDLEDLSLSEAIMAVETSIKNGWRGIFPNNNKPKNAHTHTSHRDAKRSREYPEPPPQVLDLLAD